MITKCRRVKVHDQILYTHKYKNTTDLQMIIPISENAYNSKKNSPSFEYINDESVPCYAMRCSKIF